MGDFSLLAAAITRRASENQGRPFAVLDFDNTCINNDIAEATLAYMCKNGLLKNRTLLPHPEKNNQRYHEQVFSHYYSLLRSDMKGAYLFCAKAFAGFTPDEARDTVLSAITAEGTTLGSVELYGILIARGLAIRSLIPKLLKCLSDNGIAVWIVSASPAIAVQAAMEHFAISGDLIALQNETQNGRYTEKIVEPYSIQEGKVICIQNFVDPTKRPLLGIGDSMNDLPMIEYADIHVAIDRNNALVTHARSNNWFVLQ